tara:strand:+ start:249 stop:440 length:192 start_codon:yes stop_codon:yes gene_type:complete
MFKKQDLQVRLIELGWTKLQLAKKLGITPMTLHNKFNDPSSFKVGEIERMVKIGFITSLIIKL